MVRLGSEDESWGLVINRGRHLIMQRRISGFWRGIKPAWRGATSAGFIDFQRGQD